jgi:acetoin utilization protein AcuB
MDRNTKVGQVMTTHLVTLGPNDTMDKAQDIFRKNNIHHIPVVQDNKVLGIISKTDYLKILHGFTLFKTQKSELYNNAILRSLLTSEVMTRQVATLHPDDTVEVAAGFFKENLFHALPIVNDEGNLVGIITTYDLINLAFDITSTIA